MQGGPSAGASCAVCQGVEMFTLFEAGNYCDSELMMHNTCGCQRRRRRAVCVSVSVRNVCVPPIYRP